MLLSLGKDFLGDIITGTGDVESDQDRLGKVRKVWEGEVGYYFKAVVYV